MGHWREHVAERDVEIVRQKARERFPQARPRVISDNGPQFLASDVPVRDDFKEFIRVAGMTHARTSPHYPRSNGKAERWHKTLKSECIRPKTPLCVEQARPEVERYVHYYNRERPRSAIGFIAPRDKLEGHAQAIGDERDRKHEAARAPGESNSHSSRPQTMGGGRGASLWRYSIFSGQWAGHERRGIFKRCGTLAVSERGKASERAVAGFFTQ